MSYKGSSHLYYIITQPHNHVMVLLIPANANPTMADIDTYLLGAEYNKLDGG